MNFISEEQWFVQTTWMGQGLGPRKIQLVFGTAKQTVVRKFASIVSPDPSSGLTYGAVTLTVAETKTENIGFYGIVLKVFILHRDR